MRTRVPPGLLIRLRWGAAICAAGLSLAYVIGFLFDTTPFGDDATYHVGQVQNLASNFPLIGWDPHAFAGYVPTIGLVWLAYLPTAALVRLGWDAADAFHFAFLVAFLVFGLSVFYFARSVGADRIVSFSLAILAWATNAYWNLTIWGGAYDRAFTIPLLFIALGLTYRYISILDSGGPGGKLYFVTLAAWTMLYIGDVFVALAATLLGILLVLLSRWTRNFTLGLKRVVAIFLPPVGLTLWQTVPILQQAAAFSGFRNQSVIPNDWSLLLFPGHKWIPALNPVYLPMALTLTVVCILLRARPSPLQRSLITSLLVMSMYWLTMGWVPLVWPYLPRLMATDSSVENLEWTLLIAIPVLFAIARRHLHLSSRPAFRTGLGPLSSLTKDGLLRILQSALLILVVANTVIFTPTVTTANWQPLTLQLNAGLNSNLGAATSDYRVSLENRFLTRWFPYYQPDRFQSGGRPQLLNPDPFYTSWYLTDVFYKNDLPSIQTVYVDDQPVANVSSLIESGYNFAGEGFWLDWYGVNDLAFYPPLENTLGNYSARPFLFTTREVPTISNVPETIIRPSSPSPILVATNASLVGFYSTSTNSQGEYHSLISILSKMGLDSRYVIPVYLLSLQTASSLPLHTLLTDSSTYSQQEQQIRPALNSSDVVVVSSQDGILGSAPSIINAGVHRLIQIPISFTQLISDGEAGAYFFVASSGLVQIQSSGTIASTYYPPSTLSLNSTSWMNTFKTPNSNGSVQPNGNTVNLNLASSDTSTRSQFNIQSQLSTMTPLADNLLVSFTVQTNHNITLGTIFTSPSTCCPNYVANDTKITPGAPHQLAIPFSNFRKWGNSTIMFGITHDLTFAVNLPPGEPSVNVQFTNVTISAPSYTVSDLPAAISPAENGLVSYTSQVTGIGLVNSSNDSTTILDRPQSVLTLASLSGGSANESYDRVLTVEANNSTPTISLFSQSIWSPLHEAWTTSQDMAAASIPKGFQGVLWKETYTSQWSLNPDSGGGALPFYYAGPGMIYLPLSGSISGLKANLASTNLESITFFTAPLATMAILTILRKKIPRLGQPGTTHLTNVKT